MVCVGCAKPCDDGIVGLGGGSNWGLLGYSESQCQLFCTEAGSRCE